MSSVERSFYDRLHKQVISTQAQHLASQKKRRKPGSSHNPARSVALFVSLHHPAGVCDSCHIEQQRQYFSIC